MKSAASTESSIYTLVLKPPVWALGLFLFFKYSTLYFLRKMLKNTYKKILKIIKFSYSGEVLGFIFRE